MFRSNTRVRVRLVPARSRPHGTVGGACRVRVRVRVRVEVFALKSSPFPLCRRWFCSACARGTPQWLLRELPLTLALVGWHVWEAGEMNEGSTQHTRSAARHRSRLAHEGKRRWPERSTGREGDAFFACAFFMRTSCCGEPYPGVLSILCPRHIHTRVTGRGAGQARGEATHLSLRALSRDSSSPSSTIQCWALAVP